MVAERLAGEHRCELHHADAGLWRAVLAPRQPHRLEGGFGHVARFSEHRHARQGCGPACAGAAATTPHRQTAAMGHIVLLALGAAVFPALLAGVAILLSRPSPRRLLLAFYLGGLVVSVTCGLLILSRYHDGHPVVGSTPSAPDPWTSIIQGAL